VSGLLLLAHLQALTIRGLTGSVVWVLFWLGHGKLSSLQA